MCGVAIRPHVDTRVDDDRSRERANCHSLLWVALFLLDNAPSGLRPGLDHLAVSSADNFGLGAIAAELASPYVPNEGVAGIHE